MFERDLLLHQQVRLSRRSCRIVQEVMQYAGGDVEGHVRDDREGFTGKLYFQGISVHHPDVLVSREALFQVVRLVRVVLHGHHLPGHLRELAAEHPSPGPELHHKIFFLDTGPFDYQSRDPLVFEEVLAQFAPSLATPVAPLLVTVAGAVRRMPSIFS